VRNGRRLSPDRDAIHRKKRRAGAAKEPVPAPGAKKEEETMPIRIRPLHDRVIVKRIEEEEKSKGGIIIPDTAKEKPQEGRVIAVGPGRQEDGKVIALDLKAGDRVLFGKYAGTEVELDGEDHLILREEDVLGVIEA
jgi:chaperonin GroES